MEDLRAELERLRERLHRQRERDTAEDFIEEPLPGEEVETPAGRHWEAFTHYPRERRYGTFDIGDLTGLSSTLLSQLTEGTLPDCPPERWAFLDTETTGLGGAAACAFLIGVGRITPRGFTVKQYFQRDFDEESSVLDTLAKDLSDCEALITYNGKAFDEPLLNSRYTLARMRPPFSRLAHLDLLYGSRRLWKLRFDSCRLVELETQILGLERQGDVAGSLIPHLYFEYLRTRQPHRLVPVFRHNVLDIVTLACLTAIVPRVFGDPDSAAHGAEMVGLGRWLLREGRTEEAVRLFERAMQRVEYDRLPVARKLELLLTLAKHHERVTRDYARALLCTQQARELSSAAEWQRREARLRRKLSQSALA